MREQSTLPVRYWQKVDKTPTCWLWTGARDGLGYGQFMQGRTHLKAHRVSYVALVGAIPAGLELDHLCSVRNCVRPDHLEPVDHRTNCLRGNSFSARNAQITECPQGHPYDLMNTVWRESGGRRYRRCRECERAHSRGSYVPTGRPRGRPKGSKTKRP